MLIRNFKSNQVRLLAIAASTMLGYVLMAPSVHAAPIFSVHPIALSAAYHTCALLSNGNVKCWGWNYYGQVGVSSVQPEINKDVLVQGLAEAAKDVSVGWAHSCALLISGAVQCWGSNDHGQLGVMTGFGSYAGQTPANVINLSGPAIAISSGASHTCALVQTAAGNAVQCWGDNMFWQLGNNSVTSTYWPQTISAAAGATSITAGSDHTCALFSGIPAIGPAVKCWGDNSAGALGLGFINAGSQLPGNPVLLNGALSIRAGSGAGSTCARVTDGTLRCWGQNNQGELGDGSNFTNAAKPVAVQGSYQVSAFDGNANNRCAVSSGKVLCWGENSSGELGTGFVGGGPSLVPVQTLITSGASAITVGGSHACAIVDKIIKCWGDNSLGELGNGTYLSSPVPVGIL